MRHDKWRHYTISLTHISDSNTHGVLHSRTSQGPVRLQCQLKRDEHGEQSGASHHWRRRCHAVLHSGGIVAFENVHQDTRRLSVVCLASVIAWMAVGRSWYLQPAFPICEIGAYVDALIDVVVDHTEIVVPEDV